MLSARLLLFLGPVALYGAWLAWRPALGRRPTRFVVSTSLSLVLLLYFVAVVGSGIFWVAARGVQRASGSAGGCFTGSAVGGRQRRGRGAPRLGRRHAGRGGG
jgi:hypothetical protein